MGKMHKLEIESFRVETLIAHNQYRAQHSTTPLSLSFQLSDGAQQWAEKLAESDQFERSPENEHYNESIACTWGSQLTGTLVTRMWYEEGKDYDYTRDTLSKFTQNFTQLLWKNSRELGVGRSRHKHGKEIIVARYHPPGNTANFTENVLKKSEFTGVSKPVFTSLALNRIPGLRQFQETCLLAHNKYRQRHNAPPLQWSYKLAYEAQRWAQHLLDSGQFTHSENVVYGENLAGRKGYDLNGKKATKLWYDESKSFDFENPSFSPDTGNFTQLIWRSSRYFGVGKAFNNDMCIVVAYYFPPGNIVEEFEENVGVTEDNVDGLLANETRKPAGIMAEYGQYELEKFRTEFLVFVNYLRARHASPPLTVSHLLMNNSQNWANQLLRTGKISYSNDENVGESIAYAEREDLTAFKVSHRWYGEIRNHDFPSGNLNPETLNFTQLVWHDSRELGVGKSVGKDGFSVVVAQYSPPGNTEGVVKQNVSKLCSPDLNEIAEIKKRRYDENANIIEDSDKKNGLSEVILPSRNEETFVFRPPSGEFNQLVWIDRSSTPSECTKHPDVHGDVVMNEDTPDHEYESPPPSPSRSVDQIEKLLTNTRQTWETESSGEEDITEGTEPNKPDLDEYVVLSKSASREDIGSEEGSVYKRLSRTFSDEMEFTRQESVPEEVEPLIMSNQKQKVQDAEATIIFDSTKEKELRRDDDVKSPLMLRRSQQYVHHYDKEFGMVKEASIVTRPEVSETNDNEDWQMIDDILHDPRSVRLFKTLNDESAHSPDADGQRAVLRRIENENKETPPGSFQEGGDGDPNLPVLEHVVTPTYARTVDHGIVDEAFDRIFTEDTYEDEPETGLEPPKELPIQPESSLTYVDQQYEKNEELPTEESDNQMEKVLNPIEHINITSETREYSFAVSEDVFQILEDIPNTTAVMVDAPSVPALPDDGQINEDNIEEENRSVGKVEEEEERCQKETVMKETVIGPGTAGEEENRVEELESKTRIEAKQISEVEKEKDNQIESKDDEDTLFEQGLKFESQPAVVGASVDKIPTFVKFEIHEKTETNQSMIVKTETGSQLILDEESTGVDPNGIEKSDFSSVLESDTPVKQEQKLQEELKIQQETTLDTKDTNMGGKIEFEIEPEFEAKNRYKEELSENAKDDQQEQSQKEPGGKFELDVFEKQELERQHFAALSLEVKEAPGNKELEIHGEMKLKDELEIKEVGTTEELEPKELHINKEAKDKKLKSKEDDDSEIEERTQLVKEPETDEHILDLIVPQFQEPEDEPEHKIEEEQGVDEERYSKAEFQPEAQFDREQESENGEVKQNIDEYFKAEHVEGIEIKSDEGAVEEDDQSVEALLSVEELKTDENLEDPSLLKFQQSEDEPEHDVEEEQGDKEQPYSETELQPEAEFEEEQADVNDKVEQNIDEYSKVEKELKVEQELEAQEKFEIEVKSEDEAEGEQEEEAQQRMAMEVKSEYENLEDDDKAGDENNFEVQQEPKRQEEQEFEASVPLEEPKTDENLEDPGLAQFQEPDDEPEHEIEEKRFVERQRYSEIELQQEQEFEKEQVDENDEIEQNIDEKELKVQEEQNAHGQNQLEVKSEDASLEEDDTLGHESNFELGQELELQKEHDGEPSAPIQEHKEEITVDQGRQSEAETEIEVKSEDEGVGEDDKPRDENSFEVQQEPETQKEHEVEALVSIEERETDENHDDLSSLQVQEQDDAQKHTVEEEHGVQEERYSTKELQKERDLKKQHEDENDKVEQNIDEYAKAEELEVKQEQKDQEKKEMEVFSDDEAHVQQEQETVEIMAIKLKTEDEAVEENDEPVDENNFEVQEELVLGKELKVEASLPAEESKTDEKFEKQDDEPEHEVKEEQDIKKQQYSEIELQQDAEFEKENVDELEKVEQSIDECSKVEEELKVVQEQEAQEKIKMEVKSEDKGQVERDQEGQERIIAIKVKSEDEDLQGDGESGDEKNFEVQQDPEHQKEQEVEVSVPEEQPKTDENLKDLSFVRFQEPGYESELEIEDEQGVANQQYSQMEIQQEAEFEKEQVDESDEAEQNIDEHSEVQEELKVEQEVEAQEKMETQEKPQDEAEVEQDEPQKGIEIEEPKALQEQQYQERFEREVKSENEVQVEQDLKAQERVPIEVKSEVDDLKDDGEYGDENNFEVQQEFQIQEEQEVEALVPVEEPKTDKNLENPRLVQFQEPDNEPEHDINEKKGVEKQQYSQIELQQKPEFEKEQVDENDKAEQNIDEHSEVQEELKVEQEVEAQEKMKTQEKPQDEAEVEQDEAQKRIEIEMRSEDENPEDAGEAGDENNFEVQQEPERDEEQEFGALEPKEEPKTNENLEDPSLVQFQEPEDEPEHEIEEEQIVEEQQYSHIEFQQGAECEKEQSEENDEVEQDIYKHSQVEEELKAVQEQEDQEKIEIEVKSEDEAQVQQDQEAQGRIATEAKLENEDLEGGGENRDENNFVDQQEPEHQKEQELEASMPEEEPKTDENVEDPSLVQFQEPDNEPEYEMDEEKGVEKQEYSAIELQQEVEFEKEREDENDEIEQNIDEYSKVVEEVKSEDEAQAEQNQEAQKLITIEVKSEDADVDDDRQFGDENTLEIQHEPERQERQKDEASIPVEEPKTDENLEDPSLIQFQEPEDEPEHEIEEEHGVEKQQYSQIELQQEAEFEKEQMNKNDEVEQNIDEYSKVEEEINSEDEAQAEQNQEAQEIKTIEAKSEGADVEDDLQSGDENTFEIQQEPERQEKQEDEASMPVKELKTDENLEDPSLVQFQEPDDEPENEMDEEKGVEKQQYSAIELQQESEFEKEREDENDEIEQNIDEHSKVVEEVKSEDEAQAEQSQEAQEIKTIEVKSEDTDVDDDRQFGDENTFEIQQEPQRQEKQKDEASMPVEEPKTDENLEDLSLVQFQEPEDEIEEELGVEKQQYSQIELQEETEFEKEQTDKNDEVKQNIDENSKVEEEIKSEDEAQGEQNQEAQEIITIEVKSEGGDVEDDLQSGDENTFEIQQEPERQEKQKDEASMPVGEPKTDENLEDPSLVQFQEPDDKPEYEMDEEKGVEKQRYSAIELQQEAEFEKEREDENDKIEQNIDEHSKVVQEVKSEDEAQAKQNQEAQEIITIEVKSEGADVEDDLQSEHENTFEIHQEPEHQEKQEDEASMPVEEPKTDENLEDPSLVQFQEQDDEPEYEMDGEWGVEKQQYSAIELQQEAEFEKKRVDEKDKIEQNIGEHSKVVEEVKSEDEPQVEQDQEAQERITIEVKSKDEDSKDDSEPGNKNDFKVQQEPGHEEVEEKQEVEALVPAEELKPYRTLDDLSSSQFQKPDDKPEHEIEKETGDVKQQYSQIELAKEADIEKEQVDGNNKVEQNIDEHLKAEEEQKVEQELEDQENIKIEVKSEDEAEVEPQEEPQEKLAKEVQSEDEDLEDDGEAGDKNNFEVQQEPEHKKEQEVEVLVPVGQPKTDENLKDPSFVQSQVPDEEPEREIDEEQGVEKQKYSQIKLQQEAEFEKEIMDENDEVEQNIDEYSIAEEELKVEQEQEAKVKLKMDVESEDKTLENDDKPADKNIFEGQQDPKLQKLQDISALVLVEELKTDENLEDRNLSQFQEPDDKPEHKIEEYAEEGAEKEPYLEKELEEESELGTLAGKENEDKFKGRINEEELNVQQGPSKNEAIEEENEPKDGNNFEVHKEQILEQEQEVLETEEEPEPEENPRDKNFLQFQEPEDELSYEVEEEQVEFLSGSKEATDVGKESIEAEEHKFEERYEKEPDAEGSLAEEAPESQQELPLKGIAEQATIANETVFEDESKEGVEDLPAEAEPLSIYVQKQTIEEQPSLSELPDIEREQLDKKYSPAEELEIDAEQKIATELTKQEKRTIGDQEFKEAIMTDKIPQKADTTTEAGCNEEEQSGKHVRFSFSCEVFEEESMTVVDTEDMEDDVIIDQNNKQDSQQVESQQQNQGDDSGLDNQCSWVEVEKSPVVWHTVEEVSVAPESETIKEESTPVGVNEEREGAGNIRNEDFPQRIIDIGAHALVEDVIRQARAQSEQQSDALFAPRLVRTESGNMVVVKLDDSGSLEERYELMEFELYEQYMKEKGTFSPFQLEFPCDVDKVFSSTEEDKQSFALGEELEYVAQDEEETDYSSERPLLTSHLSIIMEEPPSGSESSSSVKIRTREIPQTSLDDDSAEYVITSPCEFDIVHSTVREVQNKRHKTEIESNDNKDDEFVPAVGDEFMVLWRSQEKSDDTIQAADIDEQPLESACPREHEALQETIPSDSEVGEVEEQEKVDTNTEKKDYLKLDLRGSPDPHSESSVSPGSSVRSWVSSDLSSLDDDTTSKPDKGYIEDLARYRTDTNETELLQSIDSELSSTERENIEIVEERSEKPMDLFSHHDAARPQSEEGIGMSQKQLSSLKLEHPFDPQESYGKYVSVSTEEGGDKTITRVVKTETTRKIVKLIDGKEVPLEGEELEHYKSRIVLEKEATSDLPFVTTEKHKEKEILKTITTVVTNKQDTGPVVAFETDKSVLSDTLTTMQPEGFQAEPVVHVEEQEENGVKRTTTTVVTRKIEKAPSSEIEYQNTELEKQKGNEESKKADDKSSIFSEIIDKEMAESETEEITEELEDGTKRTTTRRITKNVETSPAWGADGQDDTAMNILEKMEESASGQSEMTTEVHEEDGVKTTVTRITTTEEIGEPVLIAEEQYKEMLRQCDVQTEISAKPEADPVMLNVTEQGDDGMVTRTVTKVVTRTVEMEPTFLLRDKDSSAEDLLQKLKELESSTIFSAASPDTGNETECKSELLGPESKDKRSDIPIKENVSYEVTQDEDGTVTKITRIETGTSGSTPVVLAEQHDVVKDVLEKTHEMVVQTAPLVEYQEQNDGDLTREVRREVREVTTMESKSELVLLEDFQARVILEHNKCRYIHYSQPITWSDKLAKEAQIWAEHLAESGCLKHSTSSEHGENVAYSSEILNGYDLSQLWYDEIRHYSFIKPGFSTQTAHFTQMVWAGTKEIGVGMALAPDGTSYYVARYHPPGNRLGCFEENVLSPRESAVEGRPRKKKSPSPPSPPNEIETIKHDCLVTHNYHRFQHGASELTWSPILAVEALHWAEKLIRTGSIQSSDTSDRGENIAISSDRYFDVKAAIESWYKEERDYKYSSPAFSSLTRNFSQMIWKECKEVGMALARSDDGNLVVVVAKYYPAGNTVGMFQENVLPKSQRGGDMSS